jgi:hypothetical protein
MSLRISSTLSRRYVVSGFSRIGPLAQSATTDRYRAVVAACLLLCACGGAPANNPPPQETDRRTQPEFVGKVWMSTDAAAARGTLRLFLPDGTLVIDSCWETYRLARWQTTGDRQLEWQEDTARIEAEIIDLTDERLQLRLADGFKVESYRLAQAPFVCPDLPR